MTIAITTDEVYGALGENVNKLNKMSEEVPASEVEKFITQAISKIENEVLKTSLETDTVTEKRWGNNETSITLTKTPVVSPITTLTIAGTSITDLSNVIDINSGSGTITLKSDEAPEETIFRNPENYKQISVTYDYGYEYTTSTIPGNLKRLIIVLAGIFTIKAQMAAVFGDITSFNIGGVSGTLGEQYTSMNTTRRVLQEEYDKTIKEGYIRPRPFVA